MRFIEALYGSVTIVGARVSPGFKVVEQTENVGEEE
jgi:hypothetical protein